MKTELPPFSLEDRVKVVDAMFKGESIRGKVILAGEILNITLAEILMRFFRRAEGANIDKDDLLGIQKPLGTFSGRILVSEALGLISTTDRKALDILRGMRNIAAHECLHVSLDGHKLEDELGKFVRMVCEDAGAAVQMTTVGPCPSSCEDWLTACAAFLLVKLMMLRDTLEPVKPQFLQLRIIDGKFVPVNEGKWLSAEV